MDIGNRGDIYKQEVVDMAPFTQQIATMVDMLPEEDQTLAFNLIKKLVLAWDPDYTRATPEEDAEMEKAIREMESGDYVSHDAINWDL